MKEFKFFTKDKRIYYEGREVVYVGHIYNPYSFDTVRRVQLMDDGGRIDQIEIDSNHPLWDELRGVDYYCI